MTLNNQQTTPWNFNLQINYDFYVWDYGRWSLNHLTFQLRSIPSSKLKIIIDEYTMKNNQTEKIAFQADSQWALTLPVDGNQQPGIYD
ncbi:unnamed protein product [Rotaria sordida]|uniref:Uncharacterized protein n=1 Tax=Rotaria sordida TaxID=392033 RepID=A0A820JIW3_9BILA|nr:unnamed protein product [Rotaria sordida]CAF4324891.1 unnamed protein product [Rotaria sordida]